MNRSRAVFLPFALCFLLTTARGDDLVKFPKGDAEWTVDVNALGAASSAPSPPPKPGVPAAPVSPLAEKPKRIEVTQMGELQRVRVTWASGGSHERWAVPAYSIVLEDDPRSDIIFPAQAGSLEVKWAEYNLPYGPPAFTWIDSKSLIEPDPISYLGKKCFHYQGTVLPPFRYAKMQKRIAWIDSETLLPVALATETALNVFTFQAPPSSPLALPPKFREALESYKVAMGIP